MSQMELMIRIAADASRFNAAMGGASRGVTGFGRHVKNEFNHLKGVFGGIQGQMAAMGAGFGMTKLAMDAGRLTKESQLLKVATGSTTEQMETWRNAMFKQQQITGTTVQSQLELSQSLQASGMNINQITTVLEPAARTMAVAKANADQLGKAMGVASEQFNVDLTDKTAVTDLLDKMLVAARAGNAELENLPDIFAKVGGRAREANMGLTDTLALVETLSKSEPQSDRLGTLVDSTLRVFTNSKYMAQAQAGTGVAFFKKDGSRRDPLQVLEDMHKAYVVLKTDQDRMNFINSGFGKADLDLQRGMMKMLAGDALEQLAQNKDLIAHASGQAQKDLAEATSNPVDQISRLTGALRQSVEDGFARPLNDAIGKGIKYLMGSKPESPGGVPDGGDARDVQARQEGLGLSGGQILAGAGVAAAGLYGAKRLGTGMLSKVLGGTFDIGKGVATGKALEHAAGVAPVYVVNMPDGGIPSKASDVVGDVVGNLPKSGRFGKWGKGAAGVGLALGAYDIYDTVMDGGLSRPEKVHQVAGTAGGMAGAWAGAEGGAAMGAAIGTAIFPAVGTALGGALGGLVGGSAGYFGGSWLGHQAGDLFGAKEPNSKVTTATPAPSFTGTGVQASVTSSLGMTPADIAVAISQATAAASLAHPVGVTSPFSPAPNMMAAQAHANGADMVAALTAAGMTPAAMAMAFNQASAAKAAAPQMTTAPVDFATRWLDTGSQMAQQNAQALTTVTAQATASNQAVSSALMAQIQATKIQGVIQVNVAASSSLLNVTASASPANANTQITANVGRNNTGAS